MGTRHLYWIFTGPSFAVHSIHFSMGETLRLIQLNPLVGNFLGAGIFGLYSIFYIYILSLLFPI